MSWVTPYLPLRDQYWPVVDAFFGNLPVPLYQQSILLRNNVATYFADTGQYKDVLCRQRDMPLFYFHHWLLNDLDVPNNPQRASLEKHLFLSQVYTFTAIYTQETMLDDSSAVDDSYTWLARLLTQQADYHLAQAMPQSSAFWHIQQGYWFAYSEAKLSFKQQHLSDPLAVSPPIVSNKLAFSKIPIAAVLLNAEHPVELSTLETMFDHLNFIYQLLQDLSLIRQDLTVRRYSYPVARMFDAAKLDPHQAYSAERLLGALVLTQIIPKLGQECIERLDSCRAIAKSLKLPTFTAHFDVIETIINEVSALFSLKAGPKPGEQTGDKKPSQPFFISPIDTLPKVIEMAEGYLLADLTFEESWEIQRQGILTHPVVIGKAFPTGMIAELLCQHDHDMSQPINLVFETLWANNFQYYDKAFLPADSDDLGLALRLYPHSPDPQKHREMLQKPLGWLEATIQATGGLPVWLTDDTFETMETFTALWGKECTIVEANMLLGLLAYDATTYHPQIEALAKTVFERLNAQGFSTMWYYVPLYSLWTAFNLVNQLTNHPLFPNLQPLLTETSQTLTDMFLTETQQPHPSPQSIAFLMLMALQNDIVSDHPSLLPNLERWASHLYKSQKYDGSWAGEPLFVVPTRGNFTAWYRSRSATTTFCYHALKTFQAYQHQ
ncbi:MAG: hypothetical protein AAF485_05710 [Chloroflexota bacterium]